MKVLVVKMSSMGDIIHTLPALTDATNKIPDISFDWVVEEAFSEIPAWHSKVQRVIPIALRRWRKHPLQMLSSGQWQSFYRAVRQQEYDVIIDAQGLCKSALVTRLAKGLRYGLDEFSARESLACLAYQKKLAVPPTQHAVTRMRQIFSQALNYSYEENPTDFAIKLENTQRPHQQYLVFLHSTTWKTKEWPEAYWIELAKLVSQQGYQVFLPWGNTAEYERASRIHANSDNTYIVDKLTLTEMACLLSNANAVVAVDTGLGHLSAALNVPTISLYGATDAKKTGTVGQQQEHLVSSLPCSPCLSRHCKLNQPTSVFPPCFAALTPQLVWESIKRIAKR